MSKHKDAFKMQSNLDYSVLDTSEVKIIELEGCVHVIEERRILRMNMTEVH